MSDELDRIQTAFTDAFTHDNPDHPDSLGGLSVDELRNLRPSAEYGSNQSNRKKFCAELTPEFVESWKEFVEIFTGIDVKNGRGSVSSPLVQFSLQFFMATIADIDTIETARQFVAIIDKPSLTFDVSERLRTIADEMRKELVRGIR